MKFTLPEPATQSATNFVKQVVFLTVNHRGPLPLRELHSTDETIVWRDPGGSWACLRPVHETSEFTLPQAVTQTSGIFVKQVVFLTVSHRGPLPLEGTSLHWRNNSVERPWGILVLFTTCLLNKWIHPATGCDTDKWHLCEAGSCSYGESSRTPPRKGRSLHRSNQKQTEKTTAIKTKNNSV